MKLMTARFAALTLFTALLLPGTLPSLAESGGSRGGNLPPPTNTVRPRPIHGGNGTTVYFDLNGKLRHKMPSSAQSA